MFLLKGEMTSSVIVKEQLLVGQVWSWEPSQLLRQAVPPCWLSHTHTRSEDVLEPNTRKCFHPTTHRPFFLTLHFFSNIAVLQLNAELNFMNPIQLYFNVAHNKDLVKQPFSGNWCIAIISRYITNWSNLQGKFSKKKEGKKVMFFRPL